MKRGITFSLLVFLAVVYGPYSLYAQADSSSVEWIKVYFDMPADYTVALPANKSNSSQDLIGTLVPLIDGATTSVDLCIYDLEHPRIGHALVRAKRRGVRVRVVTDNYNRTDGGAVDERMWSVLRKGGIISIDDDGDIYWPDGTIEDHSLVNAGADMHNKFAVIDALSPDPEDDYVWTGSTNLTYTGAFNTNNTIVIKDNALAARYVQEFEQMWGSRGPEPDASKARFHKDKDAGGGHIFYVNQTRVEVYFAPVNRSNTKPSISHRLVDVITSEAQHDIAFQAFAITPSIPMSRAIWAMSATGEVELKGVIDRSFYYRYKNNGAIWASPEAHLSNRSILPSNELRKLHHKVLILDGANPDARDQGVVVTGSYNFSENAERNNDENLLIIFSDSIANQYYQDFMGVYGRAAKRRYPPAPPVDITHWYEPDKVEDGSKFTIELVPAFHYDVRLLGVAVPSVYAGRDSSYFYSDKALHFMRNLLKDAEIRIEGPYKLAPEARYGSFQAYVTVRKNGRKTALNKLLLQEGIGRYIPYYAQHPDSVAAFKRYEQAAQKQHKGMWAQPEKAGTKILKTETETAKSLADVFPVNINTADAKMLQLLPGIGPAYAQRIIDYRKENGPFTDVDQLRAVKGIGPKTMEKLRANIVVR